MSPQSSGLKSKSRKKPTCVFLGLFFKPEGLARCSSETSGDFQRTTRSYIPEGRTPHNYRCENLKSYIVIYTLFLLFTALAYSKIGSCFKASLNVILFVTLTSLWTVLPKSLIHFSQLLDFQIFLSFFTAVRFSDIPSLSPYCLLPRFCHC
jgi:hypothetical protein